VQQHGCVSLAVKFVACTRTGHIRYMLKDTLCFVPLYGWYFYNHGCVYVRRGRGKFREDITRRELRYLADSLRTRPLWLVVFPEGTR
jgi:lysophosphatidate acyltransferase